MSHLALILALSMSAVAPRGAMAPSGAGSHLMASLMARHSTGARAEAALAALDAVPPQAKDLKRATGPGGDAPHSGAAAPSHSILEIRRKELRDAQVRLEAISSERRSLEARHRELNRRVEALKAEHLTRDPLWSSPALESLLRDSQELSNVLTQKGEEERRLGQIVLKQRERLASALDREIGSLHAAWDKADPVELRAKIVPRLRALHAERRELLLSAVAPSNQAVLPKLSTHDADDPSVLLEMADAFLDGEDKLRREEKALARHIRQLENEQELERRLSSLMEEDTLFDESERRISLSRSAHLYSEGGSAASSSSDVPTEGSAEGGTTLSSTNIDTESLVSAQSQVGGEIGQTSDTLVMSAAGAPSEKNPTDASSQGSASGGHSATEDLGTRPSESTASQTTDGAVPLGNTDGSGPAGRSNLEILSSSDGSARPFQGDWSESNSIKALRAHQAYLKARADELHRKAEEATRKARDLL